MPTVVKQPQLDTPVFNSSMARQALINSNFDVWQRGTSISLADVTQTYLADRWNEYIDKNGGTLPTLTRSQQTFTPGDVPNSYFYTRLATNGAGSGFGTSAYHVFRQKIENGVSLLCGNGKKLTVSFWARSSIASKKLGISMNQFYGTGGSPTATETITGESWTLTSSWVKYTHTFATNTLVGKTFGTDNVNVVELLFFPMWGTTSGTTFGLGAAETYVGAGNIDIAQVQVCSGDVVLPFQPKSYAEELRGCQRYYVASSPDNSTLDCFFSHAGVSDCAGTVNFPVQMRISPEIHVYNTTTPDTCFGFGIGAISATVSVGYQSNNGFASIHKTNAFTSETLGALFHYKASAEL